MEKHFCLEKKGERNWIGVILTDKIKEPIVRLCLITEVELFFLMDELYSNNIKVN